MAINKKLIHFDMTKQLFMSNANGLNNLTKPTNGIVGNIPYYSVVFLKDGYIWTHGHFINGTGIADSVSSNATISWSKITDKPSTFTPSAHTQSYTTLTGSGTTVNQAIVSSGTANGWVLKTLGSRAFDSTSYLPLAGGTMNAGAMIVWQDWGQWGASSPTYPKANGGLQWSGTSDNLKLFVEETASDDLRLILQCGDDASPQFNIRNYAGTTTVSLHSNGTITGTSIVNSGSNNNYVLLGGGGTKLISDFATSGHTHSYLPLSGGTLTGSLNTRNVYIKNGSDLNLYAAEGSTDTGDIVFRNGSGTEIGRLWLSGSSFTVRFSDSDSAKTIIHNGNYTNYTVTKTGSGASGTWGINISGNAATATKATQDSDGHAINSTYAKLASPNNLVHTSNEITMIPDSYNGDLWINYQSVGRDSSANVTGYIFGNGKGGQLAKITNGQFSGNAATSTNADKLDGYHYNNLPYHPSNGSWKPSSLSSYTRHWGWAYNSAEAGLASNGTEMQIYTDGKFWQREGAYYCLDNGNTYVSSGTGVINGTTITQVANADTVDGYHANNIYKATSHTINNPYTSNTWIRIATITIPSGVLASAGFTAIFSNRECLEANSFILTLAIRREVNNNSGIRFYYNAIQGLVPETITVRSDDGITFYVYIKSVANSWTTYYNVTKLLTEGNITYENQGTTSPISGTKTNINASKGGNVLFADSATKATQDSDGSQINTTYLKRSGGTMTGTPYISMPSSAAAISDSQPFGITYGRIQGYSNIVIAADTDRSASEYAIITSGYDVANATKANGLAIGYNTLTWKNNTVWHAGNLTKVSQLTNDSGYITQQKKLANYYDSRPTTANIQLGDGSLRHFMATSSMTAGKPTIGDSNIIHLSWDNTGGWDKQIAIADGDNCHIQFRGQSSGTWRDWITVLDSSNSSVSKSGETLTVTINGTSQSLTNTNTWRGITDAYNPATADSAISLSQKGAKNLFNVLTFSAGRWGWSGNGSHEICLIATIDTNAIYMNYPITFEISGRSMALTHITIAFENSSFVDPAVDYFCTDYSTRFYLYKSATNTWKLYGSSPDGVWGSLYLYRVKGGSYGRVTVNMESVSALPEGCQTPTFIGNVSYATKATQDSDGNAINTTYLKRSGGSMTNTNVVTNLNADTVDSLHGSNLVRFFLSPMDSGAPADSAKSWFTKTMPSASGAIVYNVPGAEKTIIAGKSSGAYGHMLQLNYDDTYLRILRYYGGNWKSTDWEKISAGYADSAGSASSATKATQDSDGNQINTTYIKKGGNQTACPNGTAITSPGGANILSIRTAATSGTDVGIFHLSDDNAYICNSSDNYYTFAVFDTDLTKDFSSEDTASFCVQSNGAGCKIRGNTVIHSGNIGSQSVASAAKLTTARTLWGQSFDGTGNIGGMLTGWTGCATNTTDTWSDGTNAHPWYGVDHRYQNTGVYSTTISDFFGLTLRTANGNLSIASNGNIGVGTYSPSYKLDVNGTLHANDATTLSSTLYVGDNATIAGTLGVYGTTTLKSATTIEANTYISGETFFSAVDAFRLNYGSYGVIHRNDGGSYWILLTDKNNQDGGFNSLRPFHIDFSTGTVYMDNNAIIDNLAFTQCNISMGGRVNATWGYDINSSDYYGLYFKSKNSSSTGILFNDDGNVGIGTTSPLRKLHVIGEAIFGEAGYVASQGTGSNYSGTWVGTGFMELSSPNPFIDFHGNMSTADYTSRLIQWGDKVRLKYENSNGVYSGYVLTCEGNHHNPVILGIFDLKRSGPGSKVWTLDNICGPCIFTLANNWGSDVNGNSNTYWTIPTNLLRVEINGVLGDNYTTKTTVKAAACIGTVMTRWMYNQPIVSNRSHEDIAGCSVECLCTDKAPGTNLYYDSNSPGKYIYITGAKPYGYDEGTNGLSMDQFRSTGHLSYQRVRFVVYGWLE